MQKRVAIKIFKRAIVLILPVYLLWFLYIEYMPIYYNRANNTRWYFIKKSLNKEYKIPQRNILFLGESRVNAGIDFAKIPQSYSFASGGASPIEMYYILNKYLQEYKKPKKIYISISPRFLSEIFAFYPYFIRNGVLTSSEMNKICSNLNEEDTTLGSFPRAKFILHKLNYLKYYQSDVLQNNIFMGYKKNKRQISNMIKNNGGRFHEKLKTHSSALNHETKYKHFTSSKILTTYLDKIFALCKNENIDLEFFFMPMNESSYKTLNSNFIEGYKKYMQSFQSKYPKFKISDSIYFYSDEYFGDESHLNAKGKIKFTKKFKNTHNL